MHITRKLGIRFLWIDSLCIVQQDRTDWESEATRMGEVFAFAYCTIAIYPPKEASGSFEEGIEGGELSRRGWISQERGLSRRTIHFVGEQMYWECGSVVWDKTSDKGSRHNIFIVRQRTESTIMALDVVHRENPVGSVMTVKIIAIPKVASILFLAKGRRVGESIVVT
ncbi:hypothetical protein SS1G_01969 [Sclerotinia sclerotiorum 1980 UF-70]|uniref:Heterokaryon incompatibility domain-containing protein n=1 Tax=Sclerotinia sclerotiorum (strain ATCC 18683 / 1980 / Ss-1) TaxID=665079 RepID=A7E9I9_SCLS1|nr:hypothetical protein SS1G_01969 [Sclerotinia sclerotiorum 1980 UF-70]EDN97041.1 hypothetical protein SS1G_01969 [Sclerotinia sclerotiorum 1980 UF-70]